MKQIITPPWQVQQRAWECAYVLRDHLLAPTQRAHVDVVYGTHPDSLGWLEIVRMFVLHQQTLGARV